MDDEGKLEDTEKNAPNNDLGWEKDKEALKSSARNGGRIMPFKRNKHYQQQSVSNLKRLESILYGLFTTSLSSPRLTWCPGLRRHSHVSSESFPHNFTTAAFECGIQITKDPFLLLGFIKYAWLASKTRRGFEKPSLVPSKFDEGSSGYTCSLKDRNREY
ncbi:hypothetical protein CDAR_525951 [Caerostris darwini]|uniref:Uncharacterized protein n=1 Tax=Caerostris darwini TaxID=1538125 RepID=A0AAV4S317_9ARAC|nr:hypothetical protein CDAR_525951 [Caerostris darwini]